MWYTIFVVKSKLSTRDGVAGRFMLYFKEYQQRLFPENKDNRFVSLSALILDYPGGKLSRKEKSSSVIF